MCQASALSFPSAEIAGSGAAGTALSSASPSLILVLIGAVGSWALAVDTLETFMMLFYWLLSVWRRPIGSPPAWLRMFADKRAS